MECTDYPRLMVAKEASAPYMTVGARPSMRTLMRNAIVVLAAVMLAACGEDGFFGSGATGTASSLGSITLLVSSPQLGSSGSKTVNITAIAKDSNNVLLADVPVVFSADSGSLVVTSSTTNAAGQATATLDPGGDYTNRTITITVVAGTITQTTTVNVTGTTLAISGETSMTQGATTTLTIVLRDSDSNPIPGKAVTVSSNPAVTTLSSALLTTDSNGQVTVNVTAANFGTDTINASSQGATATHGLTISGDQFQFTTPSSAADINLGVCQAVTINWLQSGVAVADGTTVSFSATRGTLNSDNGCTVTATSATTTGGNATLYISSLNAGPSTITAQDQATGTPSASLAVNFVATVPATMALQVDKATIGTNDPGQTNEQATITAVVRDANNNLVKGQVVRFSLTDQSGGNLTTATSTTDSLGRASTAYVSSASTTAKDGVVISAYVETTPAINDTISLTVAQAALFVRLGTANNVAKVGATQYNKQYTVIVTDASGNAAPNKNVTLSLNPLAFGKGYWIGGWSQTVEYVCVSEDILNQNGILDAGEDINSNGVLDPGNVAAVPSTVTTGADGTYEFDILYPREYANWVYVELTASAGSAGTEGTHTVTFWLPIAAEDVNDPTAPPPGLVSPFGDGFNAASATPAPGYIDSGTNSAGCGDTL